MFFILGYLICNCCIIFINCNIRDGCGPGWELPSENIYSEGKYCYKCIYEKNISFNLYEAIRSCQLENAELFYPENLEEAAWVLKVINTVQVENGGVHYEDMNADGWFLNAHKFLDNGVTAAWENGRPVNEFLNVLYNSVVQTGKLGSCDGNATRLCFYFSKWSILRDSIAQRYF